MTASLTVNRMIIVKGTHRLYDEQFHSGVNIIHGDNGSGKEYARGLHLLRPWRGSQGMETACGSR